MANLSVKAYAELLNTPLYGQLRILHEQKYPSDAPGFFKIQYYRPTLTVIRRYFQNGNDPAHFPTAGDVLPGMGGNAPQHRIGNNLRAVCAFRDGAQRNRNLSIHPPQTWELTLANVTLRATPDLIVTENDSRSYLVIDCREQPTEQEIIRTTVELLHHVLTQNGVECPLRRVEYLHLGSDTVHRWNSPRQRTITRASQTANAIAALWDSI